MLAAKQQNLTELVITRLIQLAGYLSILFVGLICIFLLKEGLPVLFEIPLVRFLQTTWYPKVTMESCHC